MSARSYAKLYNKNDFDDVTTAKKEMHMSLTQLCDNKLDLEHIVTVSAKSQFLPLESVISQCGSSTLVQRRMTTSNGKGRKSLSSAVVQSLPLPLSAAHGGTYTHRLEYSYAVRIHINCGW